MQFDQIYRLLLNRQTELNRLVVLLAEHTLHEIYDCIIATRARDCLELGTGFGATACVMAAAVEEIGGGAVTTVDHMRREPVGVVELAEHTGLTRYVQPIVHPRGYDWVLLRILREQTKCTVCEPCFDFCYLDGAHEWEPDALAALLMPRLLRPGAWLMLDDLNFAFRPFEVGPGATHPHWSDEELDIAHVGMVFDLLVKTHPDLGQFMVTNTGQIGWARKSGGAPSRWLPDGVTIGPIAGAWNESFDGVVVTKDVPHNDGVFIEGQGSTAYIRSTIVDPFVAMRNPLEPLRAIDHLTLRLRLLTPDMATIQLFWIGEDDAYFTEECSMRCTVRSSSGMQDLTFRFVGSQSARTIRMFRLDPADGPCEVLLEIMSVGGG